MIEDKIERKVRKELGANINCRKVPLQDRVIGDFKMQVKFQGKWEDIGIIYKKKHR